MDLDDSEVKYETTNNHIFSTTNLNSHSTSLCLDQSPLSSSASSSPWVYPLGLVDYDKMWILDHDDSTVIFFLLYCIPSFTSWAFFFLLNLKFCVFLLVLFLKLPLYILLFSFSCCSYSAVIILLKFHKSSLIIQLAIINVGKIKVLMALFMRSIY